MSDEQFQLLQSIDKKLSKLTSIKRSMLDAFIKAVLTIIGTLVAWSVIFYVGAIFLQNYTNDILDAINNSNPLNSIFNKE
ncbi:hypothetical protein IPJ91_02120 [bacterium]|nr:MAG: hypothetical protein IPJ91_02120 [bacterium]